MHIGPFDAAGFEKPWDSPWKRCGFAIACFLVCLALRMGLVSVLALDISGYVLFLPGMIVSAMFAGLDGAIVTALLSLSAVWYFFLKPHHGLALDPGDAVRLTSYATISVIVIALVQWQRTAIGQLELEKRKLEAAAEREKILIEELRHRTGNLFAVIQGLAVRTLDGESDPQEARQAFLGRLMALSQADKRLLDSSSRGAALDYLIRAGLEPFAGRFTLEGEDVVLDSRTAQNFSLVLHELATNASKYGALSTPTGMVGLSWTRGGNNGEAKLKFIWKETGGPNVQRPRRHGLGTKLVKSILDRARLEYPPDGIIYEAEMPCKPPDAGRPPITP